MICQCWKYGLLQKTGICTSTMPNPFTHSPGRKCIWVCDPCYDSNTLQQKPKLMFHLFCRTCKSHGNLESEHFDKVGHIHWDQDKSFMLESWTKMLGDLVTSQRTRSWVLHHCCLLCCPNSHWKADIWFDLWSMKWGITIPSKFPLKSVSWAYISNKHCLFCQDLKSVFLHSVKLSYE